MSGQYYRLRRFLAGAAAAAVLAAPFATLTAADDYEYKLDRLMVQAESLKPAIVRPCNAQSETPSAACKDGSLNRLASAAEQKLTAAVAKARPETAPLLKRDAVWFREIIDGEYRQHSGSLLTEMMKQRIETLEAIAQGFGRDTVAGRWVNAFGTIVVSPAANGAFQAAFDMKALYDDDNRYNAICRGSAQLTADKNGWLGGTVIPAPEEAGANAATASGKTTANAAPETGRLRLRLQGETLRAVMDAAPGESAVCATGNQVNQITGSYFAFGLDGKAARGASPFIAPAFDCVHPATASEEEICADPELAENDVRLNRAWKKLLSRLDAATRAMLKKDQKAWISSQAFQFPEFLHPAWTKSFAFLHETTLARSKLGELQRERIAMLEGFDEKRKGLAGLWFSHTAIIKVTEDGAGGVSATGWKWNQGDWKAGCQYDMRGQLKAGVFVSAEERPNPDTLERDGATLIVNRQDDVLAPQRNDAGDDPKAGDMKCARNQTISSTARLFPVKPADDIQDRDMR